MQEHSSESVKKSLVRIWIFQYEITQLIDNASHENRNGDGSKSLHDKPPSKLSLPTILGTREGIAALSDFLQASGAFSRPSTGILATPPTYDDEPTPPLDDDSRSDPGDWTYLPNANPPTHCCWPTPPFLSPLLLCLNLFLSLSYLYSTVYTTSRKPYSLLLPVP